MNATYSQLSSVTPRSDGEGPFFFQLSRLLTFAVAWAVTAMLVAPVAAVAADRAALERDARNVYQKLVATVPAAKTLSKNAVGVLVFPMITKAGLVIGGQYGEGVLFRSDKVAGYYVTKGASYGLQAGAQKYGYAMFVMNEKALNGLNESSGFEVGVGPSVVLVDQGTSKSLNTTNLNNDIYAFVFSQKGLMGGMSLTGSNITRMSD